MQNCAIKILRHTWVLQTTFIIKRQIENTFIFIRRIISLSASDVRSRRPYLRNQNFRERTHIHITDGTQRQAAYLLFCAHVRARLNRHSIRALFKYGILCKSILVGIGWVTLPRHIASPCSDANSPGQLTWVLFSIPLTRSLNRTNWLEFRVFWHQRHQNWTMAIK